MIQITKAPKIHTGYFYGLKRPSIDFEIITLGSQYSYVKLWENFENITEMSIDPNVKQKKIIDVNDLVKLLLQVCLKLRVPISSDFYVQEISESKFTIAIPYFYAKETSAIIVVFIKLINLISKNLRDNLSVDEVQKIQNWYQHSIDEIRKLADKSVNNFFILSAADRLSISSRKSFLGSWIIGNGVNSRTYHSTLTDITPSIAVTLANDKLLTAHSLNNLGFPGAKHEIVHHATELDSIIQRVGFPLVVKPADQERGNGVSADIRTFSDALKAYQEAQKFSKKILIEKHQAGFTHRLTVANHQIIKVVKRIAGGVFGDGKSSISQLIEIEQKSTTYKRRMERKGKHLLSLDEEALSLLKQYSLNEQYIPKKEEYIRLRRRDNINAGGNNVIINIKNVHPDNALLAKNLSKQFNFDIVGIDLIIEDIEKSWLESGATVCEINAKPQMAANEDESLYEKLLCQQIPNKGRIPIEIAIYESSQLLNNRNLLDLIENLPENETFVSCQDGLFFNKKRLSHSFKNSFVAAKTALDRKDCIKLTCLISLEDVMKFGLPVSNNQIHKVLLLSPNLNKSFMTKSFMLNHDVFSTANYFNV